MRPLAIDSHLDLSYNALSYDRDQTLTIAELRQREAAMTEHDRHLVTVSLPELRRANIAVCLATLLARAKPQDKFLKTPLRTGLDHGSQSIAHATACGQLGYYHLLESQGEMWMIRDAAALKDHWQLWEESSADERLTLPVGYILSMEGCDPITHPDEAALWWDRGLRTASLAHYGPSAYAHGTGQDGPLTAAGRDLLKAFAELGMILDLTHTNDTSWHEAYELFPGRIFASHNNCRALVPGDRQFTDEQVRLMIQRQGVIGVVFDNWMLHPGYSIGQTDRQGVSLQNVADHVDHICQIAGNRHHVAIGSDLDGGFSGRQCPRDLDTIADIHTLADILATRGYSEQDVQAFLGGNWLRFFGEALPATS